MIKPILLFLLIFSGCEYKVFYSGKDTVVVDLDPCISEWNNREGLELARKGIHLWDKVGANFMLSDELLSSNDYPVLPIRCFNGDFGGSVGQYTPKNGEIKIAIYYWDIAIMLDRKIQTSNTIAHEIGHAMKLGHVKDKTAIMFPAVSDSLDLSDSDVQEYNNNWTK